MKMKKLLFVLILVAVLTTGTAFADYPGGFGIGIQGGFGGAGGGAGVTFKLPSIPIFFVVDTLGLGGDSFVISGAGDYYLLHNSIVPDINLHWYFGFGVGVSLWGFGNNFGLAATGRLPIGLSWQPINMLEIYLQAVPQIGLQVAPEIKLWDNFWGGNLGIRVWL
jgi:hypothetical protein